MKFSILFLIVPSLIEASDVINQPSIQQTLYVDAVNGKDWKDGLTESTALKTLRKAAWKATSGTQILIKNGVYQNNNFGTGGKNNPVAMSLKNLDNIKIANYPGHTPVIEFDGAGGISMSQVSHVEITGLEIIGPNANIGKDEAMADRLLHSNYYSGRGIAIWSGDHIKIHHNVVHGCPNSGIRINQGDYCSIEDNTVYDNTWWSSNAESGIVLADSRNIDDLDVDKMFLLRNVVYGNQNFIPYYNENYDDPDYLEQNQMHVARPGYGSSNQTFIIDGSGVYVTRNSDKYLHGSFQLSYNKAYGNGINGLVVHKTDRAKVIGNSLWDNGQVSKDAPESRQPYAGLTINTSNDAQVTDNYVKTESNQDYSYVVNGGTLVASSGGNKNCKVAPQAGTGFGRVSPVFEEFVTNGKWTECSNAFTI